jgi:hypothetical protein
MILGDIEIPTEEIGDLYQIEGVIYGNGEDSLIMELPFSGMADVGRRVTPTTEQWQEFLKQADDPVTPINKAFVRKSTRQIDEAIKWQVYKRDNYTCVYCNKSGIPMTADHYLAQALGGITTLDNLRTSCRKCNKLKANRTIEEWKVLASQKGLHDGEQINQTS